MHIFQVGAGSGGIAVLDLVVRDPSVTRVTLVEPDTYAPHNVYRHLFPPSGVGQLKVELAAEWVRAVRPDIAFVTLAADITDPARQAEFECYVSECDIGICAADNEAAKFAFDALMRRAGKPWTLGEVLSGGIGGWVHRFVPGGACYGCVASYLQREVTEQPAGPPPDYSDPNAAQPQVAVPASKASIAVIAALHAVVTLEEMKRPSPSAPFPSREREAQEESGAFSSSQGSSPTDFTSLLFSLQVVPGVFESAYRPHRLRIPRTPTCLTCGAQAPTPTGDALDAAVGDALARLGAQ